jgi:dethiobiotin synthetase
MVPLTDDLLFIDMFARWRLPVVLCARSGLGTLNHTLLSLEALCRRSVPVLGVVLIGPPHAENARMISRLGAVPVLGTLPPVDPLTPGTLATAFADGFRREDFLEGPKGPKLS